MDLFLKGKRALISGSSSGLGAECARTLAREGVSVVIEADTLAGRVRRLRWRGSCPSPHRRLVALEGRRTVVVLEAAIIKVSIGLCHPVYDGLVGRSCGAVPKRPRDPPKEFRIDA